MWLLRQKAQEFCRLNPLGGILLSGIKHRDCGQTLTTSVALQFSQRLSDGGGACWAGEKLPSPQSIVRVQLTR